MHSVLSLLSLSPEGQMQSNDPWVLLQTKVGSHVIYSHSSSSIINND